MAISAPLKLKYRNPARRLLRRPWDPEGGTFIHQATKFTSKYNNSGKAQKAMQGNGVRKRAYGPW